ncbi:LuxR C-terminal-related transcriptional regulator [Kribbella sp. CA-293567]|uniref:LuxR C-terminal-related transcriptional regulator n=1 Tax=Kribbella sp. CA-293567 TaxID=3002436 RepID=UPI0022DCEC62|nr:LuxR family transcriptional regulator [Kribbella sp. CA-293567]WBQ03615.1 LuxR C-terminal-related transcriptional regulator [Kribbella sp. CA-293567]
MEASEALNRRLTARWPLVGRTDQRQLAGELLRSTAGGVLMTGGAGVGKSALAETVLEDCAAAGWHVVRTQAREEQRHVPYSVIAQLLVHRPPQRQPAGVIGAVIRQLRAAAGGRAIVIGIDDVHQLDDASVGLVQHLTATVGAKVLLTARSEAGEAEPVKAFQRRGLVHRLELPSLDRTEFTGLLTEVLGGVMDGVSAEQLWHLTQGNPLHLRHLLQNSARSGALQREDELWRWSSSPDDQPLLRQAVQQAFAELPDDQAFAMTVVALAEPLVLDLAEQVADLNALEALEERRLISVQPAGATLTASTAHPLYGELARAAVSIEERAQVLGRLAKEASGRRVNGVDFADGLLIAQWRLAAGEDLTTEEILDAARLALARSDAAVAEDLVRKLWPRHGVAELIRALVAQGKAAAAEELLAGLTDDALSRELAPLRALNLLWGLGEPAAAQAVVDTSADLSEQAVAQLGILLFSKAEDGHRPDQRELAELLRMAPENLTSDPVIACCALVLRAYLLTFTGRPVQLVEEVADGKISPPDGWATIRGATEICHVHALGLAGRLTDARSTARRYYDEAIRRGDSAQIGVLAFEAAVVEMWAGNHREAWPHLVESRGHLGARTPFPMQAYLASEQAACLAATGRVEEGRSVLLEAREMFPADSGLRDHLAWGEVRVAAYAGAENLAELLQRLTTRQIADHRFSNAVETAYLWARILPDRAAAVRVRELAVRCDSDLFRIYAAHAAALAGQDPNQLLEVATTLESLGYHGLALEAAAAGHELAAAADQRRLATELAHRAARLAERCRGSSTPWLRPFAQPGRLSARELEICRHAAAGLDNGAIAAALGLSTRTVSNHLQRSYDKLGVQGRRDLAAALSDPELPA